MVFAWNCDCSMSQWSSLSPTAILSEMGCCQFGHCLHLGNCDFLFHRHGGTLLLGFTEGWIFGHGHMRAEYQKVYVN